MIGLVDSVATRANVARPAVHAVWSPIADAVVQAVVDDHEVDFFGLAHLRAILRPEQTFTHPITGQEMLMPAERVLTLLPRPELFCAANPHWSPEDAAAHLEASRPHAWDERPTLAALSLLSDPEDVLEDAVLDALIDAVIDAAHQGREDVLVIDGIGHLQLVHKEGYIGTHPTTGRPVVYRSQAWVQLIPGLGLRAGLALP